MAFGARFALAPVDAAGWTSMNELTRIDQLIFDRRYAEAIAICQRALEHRADQPRVRQLLVAARAEQKRRHAPHPTTHRRELRELHEPRRIAAALALSLLVS